MLKLYNYHRSAYGRIVVIILTEKALNCEYEEIDPFAGNLSSQYLKLHPFKRVPVLKHNDLVLYETRAITEYLEEQFPNPTLMPTDIVGRARVRQIVAMIDNYGYLPLVWQVYVESIEKQSTEEGPDSEILQEGLLNSARFLGAIEELASGGKFLVGNAYSLADAHLIPMIDCFTVTKQGRAMLPDYPKLSQWWSSIRKRDSTVTSRPKY
ncbi:glutathione S-transferase family protein [Sneathiella marina]|uniref:Glutathione S-transferase family protein n=1 Tax=Sneathiella marina TaxID=2950108 RepID=A0ABY4W2Y1_9PROT|nr:glutathione S-transferase family protein [Sneathiella marina]USG60473.1 glutathione S-transferase family protein [Sneathiella marina]